MHKVVSQPPLTAVVGGGGSPGGATTQVQYNNAGAFAGNANLTFDQGTLEFVLGAASPVYFLDILVIFTGLTGSARLFYDSVDSTLKTAEAL